MLDGFCCAFDSYSYSITVIMVLHGVVAYLA
jgi:hypothetical protein